VAGVEETGDRRNFYLRGEDALDDGYDQTYGYELVARDGILYEGCGRWGDSGWQCDYASRRPVSRRHYDTSGTRYVLKVLWEWRKYTTGQLGCASALAGYWGKVGGFIGVLENCLNGPMERPS
jgi:hypothetical protein